MEQKKYYYHIPALIFAGFTMILGLYLFVQQIGYFADHLQYALEYDYDGLGFNIAWYIIYFSSLLLVFTGYILVCIGIIRNKRGHMLPVAFILMLISQVLTLINCGLDMISFFEPSFITYYILDILETILCTAAYLSALVTSLVTQVDKYRKYNNLAKKIWFLSAIFLLFSLILYVIKIYIIYGGFWFDYIYLIYIIMQIIALVFISLWFVHPHIKKNPAATSGDGKRIIDMSGAYSQNAQNAFIQKLNEFTATGGIADETTEAKLFAQAVQLQLLRAPLSAVFCPLTDMSATNNGNSRYTINGYVDSQNIYGAMIRSPFTFNVVKSNGIWVCTDRFYAAQ